MMATANLPKPFPGELSPEDAERFAAAFRPMWELDDAPFSATPAHMSADEMLQLGAATNTELARAVQAPIEAAPPVARSVVQSSHPPPARRPVSIPARPMPMPAPMRATPVSAIDSAELRAFRKSNKGMVFAIVGVVLAIGAGFGIYAATSSSDSTATPATTATATAVSPHEEPKIPPPPPPEPTPVATAKAAAAPEPPPKPEPVHQEAAKPEPPKAAPASRPEPPPRPVARPAPAPRPSPPPAAPKKPAGIVRDNPF